MSLQMQPSSRTNELFAPGIANTPGLPIHGHLWGPLSWSFGSLSVPRFSVFSGSCDNAVLKKSTTTHAMGNFDAFRQANNHFITPIPDNDNYIPRKCEKT